MFDDRNSVTSDDLLSLLQFALSHLQKCRNVGTRRIVFGWNERVNCGEAKVKEMNLMAYGLSGLGSET